MGQDREKLFSLTRADFRWTYYRGSGKGGQKRNKTSSACRCQHMTSGAMGCSESGRSQLINRSKAFTACIQSPEFQSWLRLEIARQSGELKLLEEEVIETCKDNFLKVEIHNKSGRWVRVEPDEITDTDNS